MKKVNFVTLLLGTVGGILFALGMCMCLLEEWNAFSQGIVLGAVGLAVLVATLLVRRKMLGKVPVTWNPKTVRAVALGIVGALLLGLGMCMTMVWEGLLIWGILVGIVGILVLLCLIPLCKGLK